MSDPTRATRFQEQEVRFYGKYSWSVFQTLWMSYKPYKFSLILCLIMGFLGRLFLLFNANMIGFWVDSLCKADVEVCRARNPLFANFDNHDFILTMFLMSLTGFAFTLFFRVRFSRISAMAVSRIYDETTYRTSRFAMQFFDTTPAGRVITRFSSDYGNVFRLFGGPLAEFFAIIFDLIAMVFLISIASPFYLPIVAGTMLLNFLVFRMNRESLRHNRRELSASRSPSIAHFAETTQGAPTIRSFIKQEVFSKRFQKLDVDYLNQKLATLRNITFFSVQMNALTALLFLATGALAWLGIEQHWVTVGSVGVAFSFVAMSGPTVQMFFEWMSQFEEAMVGVERLNNYLRRPLEEGAKLPSDARFETGQDRHSTEIESVQHRLSADVEFRSVSLRYGQNMPKVLDNVSFKVKAGERLGIVGRTGSGKSSLVQCLFQLYPLESGEILLNSKSSKSYELEHFRKHLAFIAQDPILFRGTVRENLDLRSEKMDADIFKTLEQVGLGQWASETGLQTKIEERGRNISLGERQLLCMARCLLEDNPVIIMDEATSSVDPQSEEILVNATESFFKGRTQIIIAHRLSTLQYCDKILWLEDGRVKMHSTPKEVLPIFEKSHLGGLRGKQL